MHVGLPCMKLSLSPSTQKHHDKKSGTCSVKSAWEEMTPEEKEEHRQNKEEHGIEGFEFKRRKNAELDRKIEEKEDVLSQMNDQIGDLTYGISANFFDAFDPMFY